MQTAEIVAAVIEQPEDAKMDSESLNEEISEQNLSVQALLLSEE